MKIEKLKNNIKYIDNLVDLEKENFSLEKYNKQMICDMINNDLYNINILIEEGTLIGYIIYIVTDVCELYKILTITNFRRKGYAKMLLDEMINEISKKNINKIFLEVRKDNISANNFYIKNDFKIIHVRKNYYKNPISDANVMERIL